MTNKSPYLKTALLAAQKAEQIIMEYYSKGVETEIKDDKSPVTIADKKAEQIIRKTIQEKFPEHGFLGEEYGEDNFDKEYAWVIDPIDGTKNYRRKIPFFATQIALMRGDDVIVGVSNAPAMKECLYAEKNKGAFSRKKWSSSKEKDKQIHVSGVSRLSQAYVQHESLKYFAKKNLLDPLIELSMNNMGFKGIGNAWAHHLLTNGKVDVVLVAHGRIWDFAALSLIVEEAGGKTTDIRGKKFSRKISSIASTNGHLHQEIINTFNKK